MLSELPTTPTRANSRVILNSHRYQSKRAVQKIKEMTTATEGKGKMNNIGQERARSYSNALYTHRLSMIMSCDIFVVRTPPVDESHTGISVSERVQSVQESRTMEKDKALQQPCSVSDEAGV